VNMKVEVRSATLIRTGPTLVRVARKSISVHCMDGKSLQL